MHRPAKQTSAGHGPRAQSRTARPVGLNRGFNRNTRAAARGGMGRVPCLLTANVLDPMVIITDPAQWSVAASVLVRAVVSTACGSTTPR